MEGGLIVYVVIRDVIHKNNEQNCLQSAKNMCCWDSFLTYKTIFEEQGGGTMAWTENIRSGICSCPWDKQSNGTELSWPFAWLVKNKHCTRFICISPFNVWEERKIHTGADALFLSCSWHPPRFLAQWWKGLSLILNPSMIGAILWM